MMGSLGLGFRVFLLVFFFFLFDLEAFWFQDFWGLGDFRV